MRFRTKPCEIEAEQWNVAGDLATVVGPPREMDGPCKHCGRLWQQHGWIETMEGGHIVCPGDWIITGLLGEKYPCKPAALWAKYEAVQEPPQ